MKKIAMAIVMAVATCAAAMSQTDEYDRWFDGGTLRVDCLREGGGGRDSVWVERWIDRQSAWHGSRSTMQDPFDNGDYRVAIRDAATGKEIYSRGYSNLLREYKDTPEGRSTARRFEEVLLLPMPRGRVEIALQSRDSAMRIVDQTVEIFDPTTAHLAPLPECQRAIDVEIHGPVEKKVDVVIVAQGYGDSDSAKMRSDLHRMTEILFLQEPFKSHRSDFNVRAVAGDAGARFGTFGIERYMMTFDLWHLHDMVGQAAADYIIIMVNSETYGGGAIYNYYAVSSLHRMAGYVLPHEFGHSFGGLADEYVDEELSYAELHRTTYEPLEPNITNLVDFGSKWEAQVPEGTVMPTPADKSVARTECGPIGLYEGAGYAAKGVYRAHMRCMMRDYAPFCSVCARRLEEVFELYTK